MIQEKFRNPPIIEAMLQMRTAPADAPLFAVIEKSFSANIREQFPQRQDRFESTTRFSPFGHQSQTIHQRDAMIFSTSDGKTLVQARLDGIVVSKLKPYDSWNDLRRPAEWLWQQYASCTRNDVVTHVAVRYLNELGIPFNIPFETYMRVYPEYPYKAPMDLPENINNFYLRLDWPVRSGDSTGLVVVQESVLGMDPAKGEFSLLLDLEVSLSRLPQQGLWEAIDSLRPIKNWVFQACITNKMRERLHGTSS